MFFELNFSEKPRAARAVFSFGRICVALLVIVFCTVLIAAISIDEKAAAGLAALALGNIQQSGVENPVTAVLLNYRSYDTLLEIAVLLIVAAAVMPRPIDLQLPTARRELLVTNSQHAVNPVLAGLMKWLVPLAIIVGGYLLWTGAYRPGGAFQAGAVIAGAGVALTLAGRHSFNWSISFARLLICVGLLTFMAIAQLSAFLTGTTLHYPSAYAGQLILVIEIAATVSIAVTLLLLFTQLKNLSSVDWGD